MHIMERIIKTEVPYVTKVSVVKIIWRRW